MIFLPTLSFLSTLLLIVTLAIPLELVFALYDLPLNLKVICLFLMYLPLTLAKVAWITSFLADFLTVTDFNVKNHL